MKPDKFDIKIQQAAAQYESVYNEQAWDAMEKLLDEEMPQKKKDKRKILWLFLLLFLGTGALLVWRPWRNTGDMVASTIKNSKDISADNHGSPSAPSATAMTKDADRSAVTLKQSEQQSTTQISFPKKTIANAEIKNVIKDKTGEGSKAVIYLQKDPAALSANNMVEQDAKDKSLVKENSKDTTHKKIIAPKKRHQFINSFALSLSAGPDVSGVSINNAGTIKPAYGAGISYQLSRRLTVRTGFYVAGKVYDANAPDYHPPARFWNYYPYLKYIDADCKIYEVPLIVNYNFSQTSKYHWFGSAGVSSYFMKKEDYDFVSKNPSGQTSYNSYTVRNKNQHYLSSVRLSAGYERKLKNNLSIIAEPYLSLPLTGVGYGKVKLYSTGVLLTVSIKPFAQKK